jgi:hypothetical protein
MANPFFNRLPHSLMPSPNAESLLLFHYLFDQKASRKLLRFHWPVSNDKFVLEALNV